ncbi:TIGR03067 domain-containing protein [bacterium]|nr:TIGR03067 domain-containing protein [bacterium]
MRVTSAYLFGLGAVVLGLAPLAAPAQKGDDKAPDPFQGTWEVVKLQVAGADVTEFLKDADATMTFKGNTYAFEAKSEREKGTFKFDAKAKPATIDLMITEGRGKGKTQLGIYQLDGDTLKLCMADEGAKERPTKFVSAKDAPEMVLFTLKRKKKE